MTTGTRAASRDRDYGGRSSRDYGRRSRFRSYDRIDDRDGEKRCGFGSKDDSYYCKGKFKFFSLILEGVS